AEGAGPEDGRAEQEGAPRLPHRGHLGGRARPGRDRGEVAADGPRLARRRFRRDRQRRGLAARRPHPGVQPGHLDQPLGPPPPQAAAQPRRDQQDRAQDHRQGLHHRPARALLQGRPRQGGDRPRPGQEGLRQAAQPRRAAGQPGEGAGGPAAPQGLPRL
ncbi:MAG: tmRNA-binding protein SmpB, partial [uncultured Nocardioides sp.]